MIVNIIVITPYIPQIACIAAAFTLYLQKTLSITKVILSFYICIKVIFVKYFLRLIRQ